MKAINLGENATSDGLTRMNTEDLIKTLSQDAASARIHWLSLPTATLLTGALSAGVMIVFMGFRIDWLTGKRGSALL